MIRVRPESKNWHDFIRREKLTHREERKGSDVKRETEIGLKKLQNKNSSEATSTKKR